MSSRAEYNWERSLTSPISSFDFTPANGARSAGNGCANEFATSASSTGGTTDLSTFQFSFPRTGPAMSEKLKKPGLPRPNNPFLIFPTNTPASPATWDLLDDFPESPFQPYCPNAAQFELLNTRFEEAYNNSEARLALLNKRGTEQSRSLAPVAQSALNMPRGPMPSAQARARIPVTDEVRRAIGRSGAGGKKRGREEREKENQVRDGDGGSDAEECGKGKKGGKRVRFDASDLIHITRVVVDLQPYLARHNEKSKTWALVVSTLLEQDFPHKDISAGTIHDKADALVAFKKEPAKNPQIANVIGEDTSASIVIAALLERLETQYDQAKNKSDSAKAKIKKKNDEDRKGGESIRNNSMKTLRSRPRTSTADPDDDSTDDETSTVPARSLSGSSTIEILDSDDESNARPSKRRCSEAEKTRRLMRTENERREKHDTRVLKMFDTYLETSTKQKAETNEILRAFLEREKQ
ncbi:hypothetical protein R3P38DRAFT_3168611 [Favolaschia claudopus]|uniref:Uncharacterized protein n=1 Tax=Favolaschia claudopus TaxID=2862362 RepID=A0AAW0E1W3_9AGAR